MEVTTHLAKVKKALWPYPTRVGRLIGIRTVGDKISYWQENRWRWNVANTTLSGRYRTPYCAPEGKITRHHDGTVTVYIIDPPAELWRHPHQSCFHAMSEKGLYRVHFSRPLRSAALDLGIMEVERILVEAFELRRR